MMAKIFYRDLYLFNTRFIVLSLLILSLCIANSLASSPEGGKVATTGHWIHESIEEMPGLKLGPFTRVDEEKILTVDDKSCFISTDEGKTWQEFPIFAKPEDYQIRPERALICTKKGVVILAFANDKERANWNWQKDISDSPGATLPTYIVRSLDGGKTWQPPQKLHDEWTGAIRDMIETRDGNIVFTTMMMKHDPGRHTTLTYTSKDQGKTWIRSNIIDVGGVGHHSGVTEATLTQLEDGRLWLLMRSNWGLFWEAFSENEGITWKAIQASNIDASSAPGLLHRLKSGRLILVWNRKYPEGKDTYPTVGGDNQWSDVPTSNHRGELSIMFSEDDGKSWTKPVVIARIREQMEGRKEISYPYVFEAKPGEIWITPWRFGDLRMKLYEKDFIKDKASQKETKLKTTAFRTISSEGVQPFEVAELFTPLYPVVKHNDKQISELPIYFSSGHPICLQDGSLFMVFVDDGKVNAIRSQDEGETWSKPTVIEENPNPKLRIVHPIILETKERTLWCFYVGWLSYDRTKTGSKSDIWAIKSVDGGKNWTDRQCIWTGYTGMTQGAIETKSGNILIPICYLEQPSLFLGTCIYSTDQGKSWANSKPIDIGRDVDANLRKPSLNGGTLEPAVVELPDNKILMLIRTITGNLWQSVSDDGIDWSKPKPTQLSCGGAIFLKKLSGGRIALVWNQADWDNPTAKKLGYPHGYAKASIALSDDGYCWDEPIVFAKANRIVHSLLTETSQGKLLLTVPSKPFFLQACESDLLQH